VADAVVRSPADNVESVVIHRHSSHAGAHRSSYPLPDRPARALFVFSMPESVFDPPAKYIKPARFTDESREAFCWPEELTGYLLVI
jgi:hypothetical protein